jgi:hypothetical protein
MQTNSSRVDDADFLRTPKDLKVSINQLTIVAVRAALPFSLRRLAAITLVLR